MDDSTLKSLKCCIKGIKEPLPLSPPFNKKITSYKALVTSDTESIVITSNCTESDACNQVKNLRSDGTVLIKFGNNDIEVVVDAPDKSHTTTYQIQVTRPAINNTDLLQISFSNGTLYPEFDYLITSYSLSVGLDKTVSLNAIPVNKKSTVSFTCSDKEYLNTPVNLLIGDTIFEITVTAVDSSFTKYSVVVQRGLFY